MVASQGGRLLDFAQPPSCPRRSSRALAEAVHAHADGKGAHVTGLDGHWSDEEDRRLHELPHAAQVLYLRGMRRFVQRDGTCGRPPRKLSERMFIELLTVPSISGRHTGDVVTPTRKAVRHLLDALVGSGLVVRMPVALGRFVFRLPYARRDESALTRMGQTKGQTKGQGNDSHVVEFSGDRRSQLGARGQTSGPRTGLPQSKASQEHTTTSACRSTSHARAGEVCLRLRRDAGLHDATPHRPELLAALDEGIDPELIVATALELARARGSPPNLGYVLGTVRGRLRDAATNQGNSHAFSSRRRQPSVCSAIEAQLEERARRQAENGSPHLGVIGRASE